MQMNQGFSAMYDLCRRPPVFQKPTGGSCRTCGIDPDRIVGGYEVVTAEEANFSWPKTVGATNVMTCRTKPGDFNGVFENPDKDAPNAQEMLIQ